MFFFFFGYLYFTLPDVNYLKTRNPRFTALMELRAKQEKKRFSLNQINYEWISLSEVPDMMKKCVIVSEDASFWIHSGIDWFEVRESVKKDLKSGNFSRGGSTLTQQVAKNLFLSPQKNLQRKFREWFIARSLERNLSKKRILEIYLNIAEWGENLYGIKAAAGKYFHKLPVDLTLDEMIKLAAVLPKPLKLNPARPSRNLFWRSKIILQRLKRFKYVDQSQFEAELELLTN